MRSNINNEPTYFNLTPLKSLTSPFPFFFLLSLSSQMAPLLGSSEGWCEQLEVSAICVFFSAHGAHGSIAIR